MYILKVTNPQTQETIMYLMQKLNYAFFQCIRFYNYCGYRVYMKFNANYSMQ